MTDTQAKLLEWADSAATYRKGYTGKHYNAFVCHTMNMLDKRVHRDTHICEWVVPYGFVAEAGYIKVIPIRTDNIGYALD